MDSVCMDERNEAYKSRRRCTNPIDEGNEVYKTRRWYTNPMNDGNKVYKPHEGCTNPVLTRCLVKVEKDFIPLLEEVCSRYPSLTSLIDRKKEKSKIY